MNKRKIEIRLEKEFIPLPNSAYTKIIIAGKTTELRTWKYKPNTAGLKTIKRLKGNVYVNTETGEVLPYNKVLPREKNPHLKETLNKIGRYIEANFYDGGLFITLTYNETMTDIRKAKLDIQDFIRKLKKIYKNVMYLWVLEPKASGSWHYHILVKQAEITEKELSELWVHGSVNIKNIYDVKGLACYLAPNYIANDEDASSLNDTDEGGDIIVLSKAKNKLKRLKFYPPGERIYGKSNNIKKWIEKDSNRGEAETDVRNQKKTEACTLYMFDVDVDIEQCINQLNIERYIN